MENDGDGVGPIYGHVAFMVFILLSSFSWLIYMALAEARNRIGMSYAHILISLTGIFNSASTNFQVIHGIVLFLQNAFVRLNMPTFQVQ
jgi:hypothetical protein